jgi:hypothetical protein
MVRLCVWFLKPEFNFYLVCEFWDLTLWDKIRKSWIKYSLFLKTLNKIWFVFEKNKQRSKYNFSSSFK